MGTRAPAAARLSENAFSAPLQPFGGGARAARFLATDQRLGANSWYAHSVQLPPAQPPLQGTEQADVAIVGAGLAGLSAAIELAERGQRVVLLEGHAVGWGASGRNGGQAIHGLACDVGSLEAQLGAGDARKLWDASLDALDLLHERMQRFGIDADWQSGFLFAATQPGRKVAELHAGMEHLARHYGYEQRWISPQELPQWISSPAYHAAVHDPRSGHLHPLKYTLGLARAAQALGVRLYEHSPVLKLTPGAPHRLHTAQGEVRAKQVLLAGNVYLQDLVPSLARRVMAVGTFIAATEPLGEARARRIVPTLSAVCDSNAVMDYWRFTADGRLLFGGRASYGPVPPRDLAAAMRARIARVLPQLAEVDVSHCWGGHVDITMSRAPDFGRLPAAAGTPASIYYLQGFSGHGLALSGQAGRIVAQAMHGDASRLDVFSRLRHRDFPGGRWLRTPALVAGMAWYRLRDLLG